MVIVLGSFDVAPADREAFISGAQPHAAASRGDQGCVEFTIAADSADPGRVIYVEMWDTQADLDAHGQAGARRALPPSPVAAVGRQFMVYDAVNPRPLG